MFPPRVIPVAITLGSVRIFPKSTAITIHPVVPQSAPAAARLQVACSSTELLVEPILLVLEENICIPRVQRLLNELLVRERGIAIDSIRRRSASVSVSEEPSRSFARRNLV